MRDPDFVPIAAQFRLTGKLLDICPYGDGHIHSTYLVHCKLPNGAIYRYLLQRINTHVFQRPKQLMQNLERVTAHLHKKILVAGGDPLRETLTLAETVEGASFHLDESGNCWRVFHFIEGARTYPRAVDLNHIYQVAKAFGRFLRMLSDFAPDTLHETIPDFHHTPCRYEALIETADQDPQNRAHTARQEIRFAEDRAGQVSALTDRLDRGELPLRITHNDTKISNVLIDDKTGKAACVIDLDTVMPGTALYDFGDLVRSACNTAKEDSQDLSMVDIDLKRFEQCVRGYLEETGELLTPLEIELLPFSAKLIALELGIRFLTDYLAGDRYFPTERPTHNLDRCRVQFKLVEAIEKKFEQMKEIVARDRSLSQRRD
jgi:Ser/Thr protein kinase RdoA (MazF antagonist)